MAHRPNIVLVTTDSQGWNAVCPSDSQASPEDSGGQRSGFVETPNIAGLAEDGVRFDRNYVTAPVCGPSRAGIYTGQYPHAAGCWTNGLPIGDGVQTMGEYMRELGYRTAYVGKWHLDGEYFGTGEAAPGYEPEYWYDAQNYREDIGEDLWEWYRAGMQTRVAENPIEEIHERGITREDTWAGGITDQALSFIADAQQDDRPFFLAVNYDEPHEPSLCPPPFCDRYRDVVYPFPDNHETPEELLQHGKPLRQQALADAYANGNCFMNSLENSDGEIYRPLYFGCVEFVDSEMGRVFDAIDGETIVAFTADHGHYLGAHGLDLKHFALYDEVTRVPLILRGPEIESSVTDALVSQIDLLPTFIDAAGGETKTELHGESFLPVARDPSLDHRESALISHNGYGQGRTDGDGFYPVRCLVTDDGYKLSLNLLETDELYDLDSDPGELHNALHDDAQEHRRAKLHDRLLTEMSETDDAFHGQEWARRGWRNVADPTHPG